MNEQMLRLLEFDKIIAMLAAETSCGLGRNLAIGLMPLVDRDCIGGLLAETTEARRAVEESGRLPLGGLHDVGAEVERARLGGVLGIDDLLHVGSTITGGRRLREYFAERRDRYPRLAETAGRCGSFRRLEEELARCLGPAGEILDDASPELRRLRNLQRTLANRIHDKLESYVHSHEHQKYLQDALVTLRNDRYVIPVRQEYKGMFPGIVHDQSASGATVYVEPMAVVELNNELRAAQAAEEDEVHRLLASLSAQVGEEAGPICETLSALAAIDLAVAKGRLSLAMRGSEPEVNEEGWLELRGARHPLLQGEVVPIDLTLGREFTTVVITGPNTGGKTVSLKTVGLLCCMAQSGLHIPARAGSTIAIFTGIACDIGDEQSIEQSLSTFSSHMTNIVKIFSGQIGPRTLVLLDELGAGTDPTEGAALAIAILEYLHAHGVRTVATTHYSELKAFAYETQGVQNASVEFDVATLKPTYRLLVGLPGRSNAFAIARRLGLADAIITRAEAHVSSEDRHVEDLIGSIAEDARAARDARHEAEQLHLRGDRLKQEYEKDLTRLRQEKEEILRTAKREARELLLETRREAENLLRLLQEAENSQERRELAKEIREEIKNRLERIAAEEPEFLPIPAAAEAPLDLRPGEAVQSLSLAKSGHIISLSGGEALVQVGIMRINLPLADLRRPEQKAAAASGHGNYGQLGQNKALAISMELDLRGMRVDEALAAVEKYLDDLVLAGMNSARIIHGKGTGALRQAISAYLKAHRHVGEARLGHQQEGGAGVTVITLR